MTRVQWSLFAQDEAAASVPRALGPLRTCAGCVNLTPASEPRYRALGLSQCKLDGIATYRSTLIADGSLRVCDKGLRDANRAD